MICRWRYFKTTDSSELVTGWVKSNRYLPLPKKERKNIKFHKGSLRIACSKWRDCEHAIIPSASAIACAIRALVTE